MIPRLRIPFLQPMKNNIFILKSQRNLRCDFVLFRICYTYSFSGDCVEIFKYLIFVILLICELFSLYYSIKKGGFFKIIFLNALLGILAITVVNISSEYTNCYIPINLYSVIFPCAFGVPAVICLIMLKFIFL